MKEQQASPLASNAHRVNSPKLIPEAQNGSSIYYHLSSAKSRKLNSLNACAGNALRFTMRSNTLDSLLQYISPYS